MLRNTRKQLRRTEAAHDYTFWLGPAKVSQTQRHTRGVNVRLPSQALPTRARCFAHCIWPFLAEGTQFVEASPHPKDPSQDGLVIRDEELRDKGGTATCTNSRTGICGEKTWLPQTTLTTKLTGTLIHFSQRRHRTLYNLALTRYRLPVFQGSGPLHQLSRTPYAQDKAGGRADLLQEMPGNSQSPSKPRPHYPAAQQPGQCTGSAVQTQFEHAHLQRTMYGLMNLHNIQN